MIIVRLAGGLGNQMFQYACGRSLAHAAGTALGLDHSLLEDTAEREDFTRRDYALGVFGIDLKIAGQDRRALFAAAQERGTGYKIFREKNLRFTPVLFERGKNQYLEGYFHDERYFASVAELVRRDFSFPPPVLDANAALMRQIAATDGAVSVHVRRGDYLTIAEGNHFEACSARYYQEAVRFVQSKVKNPVFFVFSADDPQWAEETFRALDVPFTLAGAHNIGARGYEDMRMMSLCKHNIVANSSFSWWGGMAERESGQNRSRAGTVVSIGKK